MGCHRFFGRSHYSINRGVNSWIDYSIDWVRRVGLNIGMNGEIPNRRFLLPDSGLAITGRTGWKPMPRGHVLVATILVIYLAGVRASRADDAASIEHFEKRVRPLL